MCIDLQNRQISLRSFLLHLKPWRPKRGAVEPVTWDLQRVDVSSCQKSKSDWLLQWWSWRPPHRHCWTFCTRWGRRNRKYLEHRLVKQLLNGMVSDLTLGIAQDIATQFWQMLHFNFNTLHCSIDHQLLDWIILHNNCPNCEIGCYSLYSSPLFLPLCLCPLSFGPCWPVSNAVLCNVFRR